MARFTRFSFIVRVMEHVARGTPWRVTSVSDHKIILRWGGAWYEVAEGVLARYPAPPFDYETEQVRIASTTIPGIKLLLRPNGVLVAKLGQWTP